MVDTPEAIRRNARNPDAIVEAGELTDWRFPVAGKMSLRAAKIFHLLIQGAGVAITENQEHRMTYASLKESFHVSNDELASIIRELQTTLLEIKLNRPDGTAYIKSGAILSDAERDVEATSQAELRYTFSPTLRKAISNSTHWAVISKAAVLAFQSKYALRLYTLLSLKVGLRKTSEDYTIEDLRNTLGIPHNAYPLFGNLKQKVLKPAIAELNQLAGFRVGFTPLKHGRSIHAVRFTWGVKSQEDRVQAYKELERSRVGRKARRQGKVELVAPDEQISRQEIALLLSQVAARNPDEIIE